MDTGGVEHILYSVAYVSRYLLFYQKKSNLMQPLKILTGSNPILERVCRADFTIPEWLIPEMFRLMRAHKGLGLAAPQVGIDARLFITAWGEIFINPILTSHSKFWRSVQEGCLSFPGELGIMNRWVDIKVGGRSYTDEKAIIIQHELDHLNGITIATGT